MDLMGRGFGKCGIQSAGDCSKEGSSVSVSGFFSGIAEHGMDAPLIFLALRDFPPRFFPAMRFAARKLRRFGLRVAL